VSTLLHLLTGKGWQRWVEEVDWPDWRSWLRRIAWTVWAAVRPAEAPWQRAPETGAVGLTVRAYEEDEAGDQVRARLAATWPAFHRWWREGRTIPLVIRWPQRSWEQSLNNIKPDSIQLQLGAP
jgi:hypothetical protein